MVILLITIFSAGITDNAFNNITAPVFMLAFFVFHSMNRFHLIHTSKNAIYPRLIIILLIYFTGYISIYNFNRRVHDIDFTNADLKKYSPQLGLFLKTQPDIYSVNDIGRLYTLMQTNKCLYVGDLMFMYSLTGQKNPWPLIHIHDGTSYSSGDETAYAKMKLRLLQNIHDTPVGLIV